MQCSLLRPFVYTIVKKISRAKLCFVLDTTAVLRTYPGGIWAIVCGPGIKPRLATSTANNPIPELVLWLLRDKIL